MRKIHLLFLVLALLLPLSCTQKAGDTKEAAVQKGQDVEINFLVEQDRWGEIAPCG